MHLLFPIILLGLGAIYGPGIQGDSLANTALNKGGMQLSCRFRAERSGELAGVRPFLIWSFAREGYHAGTGGTLRVELQEDDGTPLHAPSGRPLAISVRPMTLSRAAQGFFPLLGFDRKVVVKAGSLYHLVYTNSDDQPGENFLSVNAIFTKSGAGRVQPRFANDDWAMLWRVSPAKPWALRRTAGTQEAFTPILEVDYQDGASQGLGYVEFWMGAARPITGPKGVRETFTVTGPPRNVLAVSVRTRRLTGKDPITFRLEQTDGKLLAESSVPASQVPVSESCALGGCVWTTATFPAPQSLLSGRSYHLVLSAPPGTTYEVFPMRKGTDKGFSEATLFPDGHAEFNLGDGWRGWEQWGVHNRADADLQFYFTIKP